MLCPPPRVSQNCFSRLHLQSRGASMPSDAAAAVGTGTGALTDEALFDPSSILDAAAESPEVSLLAWSVLSKLFYASHNLAYWTKQTIS